MKEPWVIDLDKDLSVSSSQDNQWLGAKRHSSVRLFVSLKRSIWLVETIDRAESTRRMGFNGEQDSRLNIEQEVETGKLPKPGSI